MGMRLGHSNVDAATKWMQGFFFSDFSENQATCRTFELHPFSGMSQTLLRTQLGLFFHELGKYFLWSEVIVMSFFVTRPKKVTHPRSKVDADSNWCRTLLCFCHLQLYSTTNECWAIQILKEVVRFLLPRKSQKLEFLAERFNFFGWQQVLTSKNLSNHNRDCLLPILKFPNFPAWLLLATGGSI